MFLTEGENEKEKIRRETWWGVVLKKAGKKVSSASGCLSCGKEVAYSPTIMAGKQKSMQEDTGHLYHVADRGEKGT